MPRPATDPPWPPAALLTGEVPAEVMDAAAATTGSRRHSSRLHRLHHRPGERITRVEHAEVEDAEGHRRAVTLVAHARRAGVPAGATTVEVAGVPLAVWAHPDDPYLPGLRAAHDPSWVADQLMQAGWPTAHLRLRLRSYRATRAAVIEVTTYDRDGDLHVAFLKVLRARRATRLATVHRTLYPQVPVPPLVHVAAGVVVLGGLPGTTLRRRLRDDGGLPDPATLVGLTERLRDVPVVPGGDPDGRADPGPHLAGLRAALPDLGEAIDEVTAAARAVAGPRGTVHGDLHPGQLLLAGDRRCSLVDLDDVGTGTLAHDAGTLVAYLGAQRDARGDPRAATVARAEGYAARVSDAYRELIGHDQLRAATAGRWLALASTAHRAGREPTTRCYVERAVATLRHR